MKILHVITTLERGGAEAMLFKLLARMNRARFESSVVSLTPGGRYRDMIAALGINVHELGMRRGVPDARALFALRKIVREEAPDVLHGWMYHGALGALLLRASRPTVVAIHHALHDLERERLLTRIVIRSVARLSRRRGVGKILYCGASSRRQHEAAGYDAARGIVIPNGFDCEDFRPRPDARAGIRAALGIPEDAFVVGHVGRYHPIKNQGLLVEAFARAAGERADARLVLVGAGLSEENTELTWRIERYGLVDKVALLGERGDVPVLMSAFDVLVNSSRSESFPNVLGEAMACGVPCVATDVGDCSTIVGDTGTLVPPGDAAVLAEAIASAARLSPAQRALLGARARERILAQFSLAAVVERYEHLYEELGTAGTATV